MLEPTFHAMALDPDGPAAAVFPKGSEGERDLVQTWRDLVNYDRMTGLAVDLSEDDAKLLIAIAWGLVEDAAPVRLEVAELLLEVPVEEIDHLVDAGALDRVKGSPPGLSLESVIDVKETIEELRELGADGDLVAAAIAKFEMEALQEDDRFIRSLEQMKRGERGKFPARYKI